MPPAHQQQKRLLLLLLCVHHLDCLHVLAIASVVRLNGGTICQMAKQFPNSESAWGLRTYLILIGCAADRQTVTYDALARRIKGGGPELLAKPLALVARWCQHHSLPALASLVVEQATGLPAPAFDAVSRDEIPREQERVWAFDWYGIFPPTLEELAEN
jgi:hypothetical protein